MPSGMKKGYHERQYRMLIIAHRGASQRAPENTLSALRLAAESGATWVEADVQLSQDNVPVIFHDETLARVAGSDDALAACTWKQLQGLDVGRWFSSQFAGERIPSLSAWLTLAASLGINLNLELKGMNNFQHGVDTVLQQIQSVWPPDLDYPLLSSFNEEILNCLAQQAPSDCRYALNVESDYDKHPECVLNPRCVSAF